MHTKCENDIGAPPSRQFLTYTTSRQDLEFKKNGVPRRKKTKKNHLKYAFLSGSMAASRQ